MRFRVHGYRVDDGHEVTRTIQAATRDDAIASLSEERIAWDRLEASRLSASLTARRAWFVIAGVLILALIVGGNAYIGHRAREAAIATREHAADQDTASWARRPPTTLGDPAAVRPRLRVTREAMMFRGPPTLERRDTRPDGTAHYVATWSLSQRQRVMFIVVGDETAPEEVSLAVVLDDETNPNLAGLPLLASFCAYATQRDTATGWATWLDAHAIAAADGSGLPPRNETEHESVQFNIMPSTPPVGVVTISAR